jgi:hypothetical protein
VCYKLTVVLVAVAVVIIRAHIFCRSSFVVRRSPFAVAVCILSAIYMGWKRK